MKKLGIGFLLLVIGLFVWNNSVQADIIQDGSDPYSYTVETRWRYVATGDAHTVAVTEDGRVFTWGYNNVGQLGDGSQVNRTTPTEITSRFTLLPGEQIIKVDAGALSSVALTSQGRVFAWGSNDMMQFGFPIPGLQLAPILIPIPLAPEEVIRDVAAGSYHTLYVTSTNRVLAVGSNGSNEVSLTLDPIIPFPIDITTSFPTLASGDLVVDIQAGLGTSVLTTMEGHTYVWGDNSQGQLGMGELPAVVVPTEVNVPYGLAPDETIIDFAFGPSHTLVLTSSNRILAMGDNSYEQLGDETTTDQNTPINVTSYLFGGDPLVQFKDVVAGDRVSMVITEDGSVVTFGYYAKGMRGDGSLYNQVVNYKTDITASFATTPIMGSMGMTHSVVVTETGLLYTFGENNVGQIGNGAITSYDQRSPFNVSFPVRTFRISPYGVPVGKTIADAYVGARGSVLLMSDGSVYFAGEETLPGNVLVKHEDYTDITSRFTLGEGEVIVDVEGGNGYFAVITNINTIYLFGNYSEEVMCGAATNNVYKLNNCLGSFWSGEIITDAFFGYNNIILLTSSSRVWSYGDNSQYQVGNASSYDPTLPVNITSYFGLAVGESITDISIGPDHVVAMSNQSRVFAWGYNNAGQTYPGSTTSKTVPTDITSYLGIPVGDSVVKVRAGNGVTAFTTTSGDFFIWGQNGWNLNMSTGTEYWPVSHIADFSLPVGDVIVDFGFSFTAGYALTSAGDYYFWADADTISGMDSGGSAPAIPYQGDVTSYLNGTETIIRYDIFNWKGAMRYTDEYNRYVSAQNWAYDSWLGPNALGASFDHQVYVPELFNNNSTSDLTHIELVAADAEVDINTATDFTISIYPEYNITSELDEVTINSTAIDNTGYFVQDGVIYVTLPMIYSEGDHIVFNVDSLTFVDGSTVATTGSTGVLVEFISDTTPPTFDVPVGETVSFGSSDVDWTTYITNIEDDFSSTFVLTEVNDSINYSAVGTYSVTVSVADGVGNIATQTFDVEVIDDTAPTFDITNQTIEAGDYTNVDWTTYITNIADDTSTNLTFEEVSDGVDYDTYGTYSVTVRVADEYGNATEKTISVLVDDTTAPTFDLIAEQDYAVGGPNFNWTTIMTNVTDNSDCNIIVQEWDYSVQYWTIGTYSVKVRATDNLGNYSEQTFTVNIVDGTPPTFDDITDKYWPAGTSPQNFLYQIRNESDNVTATANLEKSVVYDDVQYTTPGVYTVTVRVTDEAGNYTDKSFNVQIYDSSPPWTTNSENGYPETVYIEIGSSCDITWSDYITVYDNATGAIFIAPPGDFTPDCSAIGSYLNLVFNISDASGNAQVINVNVYVVDTTAPTFDAIGNQTIDVGVEEFDFTTLFSNVQDNSGGTVTLSENDTSVTYGSLGSYQVTVSATDPLGNVASETFTVTIADTTAPVITRNGDYTVYLQYLDSWVDPGATCTDNVDETCTIVVSGDTVDTSTLGSYTIVYTATDNSGNSSQEERIVVVQDTTAPVITLTGDETIYVELFDTYIEQGATFTDNYDPSGDADISGDTVDTSTLGTYIVRYNKTDTNGNTTTEVTRTVIVQDTTQPTFESLSPQTIEAGLANIDWTTYVTVTDNDPNTTITVLEVSDFVDYDTPGTYPVTLRATDSALNYTDYLIVVIVEDTTAPTITVPVTPFVEAGEFTDVDWTTYIVVSDNSDDTLTVIEVSETVDYDTPGDSYTVDISVTDGSGNETTETITVMVVDTTAPTFDAIEDQTIEAGSIDIDWTSYITNIVENSDQPTVSFEVSDGVDYDTPGTYTVMVAVRDSMMLFTAQQFTVTVVDTTAPTFNTMDDQTIESGGANIDWTLFVSGVSDNSDDTLIITEEYDDIIYDEIGVYTASVSIADQSGNKTTQVFTITVVDTSAPTFSDISDQTIEAGTADIDWRTYLTWYSDNAQGVITLEETDLVDYDTVGDYEVTITLTDETGNAASKTFTVSVEDTTAPDYVVPDNVEIEVFSDDIDWTTYIENILDASDDNLIITEVSDPINYDVIGSYTVTVSVEDDWGNVFAQDIGVIIVDTEAPTVDPIPKQTFEAGEYTSFDWETLLTNVSDNYDAEVSYVVMMDYTDFNTPGLYVVVLSLYDSSYNEINPSFQVVIVDTIAPTFDTIGDQTIESGVMAEDIDWTTHITNVIENSDDTLIYTEVTDTVDYDTPGVYSVTVTLEDESGNSSSETFAVTVEDTSPPEFNTIPDQTIEVGTADIDWTTYMEGVSDSSDTPLIQTEVSDLVDYDSPGSYTVTVKLEDQSGNYNEQTFTVIVEDTLAPQFDSIDMTTIEAGDYSDIDWTTHVTFTDASDTVITTGEVDDQVDYDKPGTYTVEISAEDETGNKASETFSITVVDTTPPTFDTIEDPTIEAKVGGDVDWSSWIINASDNSDTAYVYIEVTDTVDYDTPGDYTVEVALQDESGNETSQSFTVTVEDTREPYFDEIPETTIEAGTTDIDWTSYITNLTDNADGDIVLVETYDYVDYDTPGSYQSQITATDESGNVRIFTINVIVEDTTPPSLNGMDVISITLEAGTITERDWTTDIPQPTDNSDGTITLTVVESVDFDTPGTYLVEIYIEDESGNRFLESFDVTIEDTTLPIITGTQDIEILLGEDTPDYLAGVTASDNYDGDLTSSITVDDSLVDYDTPGTYDVVYAVTDSEGNEATVTIELAIIENVPPVITLNACLTTVYAGDDYVDCGVSMDDLDATLVVTNDVDTSVIGVYTYTYTATDIYGNEAVATRYVHVIAAPDVPVFELDKTISTLLVGETYEDGECMVYTNANPTTGTDCTVQSNTVDTTTPGIYTVVYAYGDYTYTRYVFVIDGINPLSLYYVLPTKEGDLV